jgi:hypothetical protein
MEIKAVSMSTGDHVMWVVYEHPADFPEDYVARRWVNGVATETCLRDPSLGKLRVLLCWNYPNLRYFPRHPNDEPQVKEMWA